MLLTSGGLTNPSIRAALVDLLDKPIEESTAIFCPTAMHGMRNGSAFAGRAMTGSKFAGAGWKSVGLLELSAVSIIDQDYWVPAIREADALLVDGGDPLFLTHWFRESGLDKIVPTLEGTVYVGLSAGSTVLGPTIGEEFVNWVPPSGPDPTTLGIVDFAMFPHLDYPGFDDNILPTAKVWASKFDCPAYVVDDDTAVRVVDGEIDVVSEGSWTLLNG
jgi:dipeptidase E